MAADRVTTGSPVLDALLDAFRAFTPTPTPPSSHGDNGGATTPMWERMFFDATGGSPGLGSAFGAGAVPRAMELWSDMAQRSIGAMAALGTQFKAGDPLGEALEKSFGVAGEVGGVAAEVPAILAEFTKASSVVFAARERYNACILASWQRAFEEVTREAVRRAGEGQPAVTPAQWLALSNSVADRVFVEAFNAQTYLDAQQQLSSALADQRRAEMKLVDAFARFGHFPTRRALDDVSAEVRELRRRVRRLERVSRGASAKPPQPDTTGDDR